MKQKSISVIIPVYNVAAYLPKCLDSLYAQYVPATMEIILVDDGSTDNSLSICRQYKERYPTTILINKPKDSPGTGGARNAGIKVASGKYIYFLDSDDWIVPDALMQLYRFEVENQCEVVQGRFYYAYADHLLYDTFFCKKKRPILLTKEEGMKALIEDLHIKNFVWGKLYKSDIVKRHPFRTGVYFLDVEWQHLIMDEVTRYGIIPEPLYYYRQRKDSITGQISLNYMDFLRENEERWQFVYFNYKTFKAEMGRMFFYNMQQLLGIHETFSFEK